MKDRETTDLILLNIGYAVHRADWNYKNVNSPFARIYLVKEGYAKLHMQGIVQNLTPGHLYIIPPFTLHSYECDDYYTLYYIHIYENQFPDQRILEDYIFPVEIKSSLLESLLVERLMSINPGRELKGYDPSDYDNSSTLMQSISLHTHNPGHAILETKGILFQLVSRFLKNACNKYEITDNRIIKTLRYIRKHIHEPITIDELTQLCFLSKDHFIRLFKKEMLTTPTQYINQKKIERAQLILLTSNQSIKDIAYNLSFEDVSYFNRLFKKYTGVTPAKYKYNM